MISQSTGKGLELGLDWLRCVPPKQEVLRVYRLAHLACEVHTHFVAFQQMFERCGLSVSATDDGLFAQQ